MTTKVETLEAKIKANQEAQKKLRAKLEKLAAEGFALGRDLHRAKIADMVGQQVKRKYRSSRHPELNDAEGTLIEVRRTNCTVDFGELGEWDMQIRDVAAVSAEQGMEILF
jgi:hypothetical protein